MMKHGRRLLALLMVLFMVVSMIPDTCIDAFATEVEVAEEATTEETAVVSDEEETVEIQEPVESKETVQEDTEETVEISDDADEVESEEEETEEETISMLAGDMEDVPMLLAGGMTTITKTKSVPLDTSKFYNVFHLDCGRKYFTVQEIKNIIDKMYATGYNTLELAIGNDGLRFLLDDMSVTVDGKTYTSDAVKAGINAGNKAYYDAGTNELTQTEMDTIIAYANSKGISILPLINSPGHMDAILTCMKQLGISNPNYSTSVRTVDITNATAANFTLALINKYITYFAGKGSTMFNMGADEYANDIQSQPQFAGLISAGKYGYFVEYVNNMAAQIQNAGMTPVAFNDGIYYNQTTSAGTFDTNIVISYWSSGWDGYNVASASYLASKGFKILNTNGDWYYVTNQANINNAVTNINKTPYNYVMGTGTMSVVGCMICTWCDTPSVAYVESDTLRQIQAFADANPSKFTQKTLNTVWTTDKAVGVTGYDLQSVKATAVNVAVEGASNVAAYDVNPSDSTGAFTSAAEVQFTIPSGWDTSKVKGFYVEDGTVTMVDGSVNNGVYKFEVPHFSEMGIAEMNEGEEEPEPSYTKEKTITMTIGETKTETVTGNNYAGTYATKDQSIATVTVTGTDAQEGSSVETTVTSVSNGSSYYIKNSSGQYLNSSGSFVSSIDNAAKWTWNGTKLTNGNNYLRYNNGWTITNRTNSATTLYFNNGTFYGSRSRSLFGYSYSNPLGSPVTLTTTDPVAATTTITFNALAAGTTSVVIGDTKYTIVVSKKTQNITLVEGATATRTDSKASTAVSADTSIVTVSSSGSNLTFKGISEGTTTVETDEYIYTVKVTKEDLSNKNVTIEYWITNKLVESEGANSLTLNAATSTVNTENGAAIDKLVPAEGTTDKGANATIYWKATRLASDNKQTTGSGVDKTLAGTDFTRIRYYNGSWAYYDGTTWTNFDSDDQIVAYYLQKTTVTTEVETQVVDWGPVKENWDDLGYLGTKYVLLDYAVKYENGLETPGNYTNSNSLAFHCDVSTQKNGVYYRTIGMTRAAETANFDVYMITATPTSDNASTTLASTAAGNGTISYGGTEKVVWAETQADLDNSGLGTWTSISGAYTYSIGGDPIVPGMEIYRQQGMKITYYVRAKVTEDALTVNYVNETTGENFYQYNIAVKSGTTFNAGIKLANPWKANLTNGSVTNILGKTQTVSADLSTMPAIGVSYRYSDYTCTKVERSDDGKTVTLYYTFNNEHSFVADFGLPLKITTSDLGISGNWTSATVTGVAYGTATVNVGNGITGITYTPNTTLKGVEQLSLTLSDGADKTTHIIYIYPATTVYYEEGFASFNGTWTSTGSKGQSKTQSTVAVPAEAAKPANNPYGYDSAYSNDAEESAGTEASTSTAGAYASFEFTGTGVDIYANCKSASGNVLIQIQNAIGSNVKAAIVRTNTTSSIYESISGSDEYGLPIYSIDNLDFGTYRVVVKNITGTETAIDGFRVYRTMGQNGCATDTAVYQKHLEDNPSFYELRDMALTYAEIDAKGEQVHASINKVEGSDVYAVITNNNETIDMQPVLDNGPKNELFLAPNQAVTFKVNTNREVQVGLKAINGSTTYTVNGNSATISTATDMFYTVLNKAATKSEQTVTITNTGSKFLSVTKIKVCDDPNATFGTVTESDLDDALIALGLKEAPAPEVEYADASLAISLVDYTGASKASKTITANGIVGEEATFSASDIEAAVKSLLPAGYAIAGDIKDATLAYGEDGTLKVQIGKVATLKITYKKGKNVVGTATLTHVQTSKTNNTTFSTSEIKAAAPAGYTVISLLGTSVKFGSSKNLNATCY